MAAVIHQMPDDSSIPVEELRDGQIAVIVQWGRDVTSIPPVGSVVQRVDKKLVLLGIRSGLSYGDDFFFNAPNLRVRVLKNGTLLRVVDNDDTSTFGHAEQ